MIDSRSPSFTPFGGSDFLMEEIEAFLEHDDSIPPGVDDIYDYEGDIVYLEQLLSVSPVHCVPKKGGITVVKNEENELIPTRLVTGWRVCIDYQKLNDATRKDHFPLPFMDQMLERLAGNEYYCFLDGFSGYFQIPIDPLDQEKTTFTCPYGTFAYRRMADINPPIVTMADNRTMAQLLEAPTVGYEDAIVVPEITANNFEIKHGLLNLV
ncbi:hypothetical protein Tco_1182191 [Tanacetum coccineum]